MQLVRIAGPTEAMLRLAEVDGLDFERTSASRLDDDTWQVAGYATDDALAEIERRGLTTQLVVGTAELTEQRASLFAAITREEPPGPPDPPDPPGDDDPAGATPDDAGEALMAYPSTVGEIEDGLAALAAAHPALCTRSVLPDATHEGRRVSSVRVATATGGGTPVLFIGGAHAREWVPPDALLTLLERLLAAYEGAGDLVVPAFTDTAASPDIPYPQASIAAAEVKRIVEGIELHVIACINPDGRAFTQSAPANAMWRKNRRPPPAGSSCRGVDCNRNHDIAWDYDRYYTPAGAAANSASHDPCDPQVYVGPAAESEPEVRNVATLLRERRIAFFVDVHSFSRKLLYPWGMDADQTRDASQNYANAAWDGRRDGTTGGPYGEYIAADALARHVRIGGHMRDAILGAAGDDRRARVRSEYAVEPGLALYPTTGTASDYAYAAREDGSAVSWTLECGSDADGEGGFQPVPAIYPKIEREVHLALLALLSEAAAG